MRLLKVGYCTISELIIFSYKLYQMSKCIFIFDDDVDILEVCSITLETEGYKVVTASNCDNILDKVAATAPDLIIMDNKIPDTGGIIASNSLKASTQFHHIPILF